MALEVGIARAAINNGEVCGDMAHAWSLPGADVVAIADGLGHGPEAAQAAQAAMTYLGEHLDNDSNIEGVFAGLHRALGVTRGAAVAVAMVEPHTGAMTYGAIGNTRAGLYGWQVQRLDAQPGIVGFSRTPVRPLTLPLRPGDSLVLWTDGIDERLSRAVPVLEAHSPSLAASLLLREHFRGQDDGCVVVARFSLTKG